MEEEQLACLGEAALLALHSDSVSPACSALGRGLFPRAATLRLDVLTGSGDVLASVGSLLAPGPLELSLHPVRASAAGAAILLRRPIFVTAEAREQQGLACFDFDGDAVFCLPIVAPPAPAAAPEPPPRRLGALLLSFQSAALLDGPHASRLLLLAAALAPGLPAAAQPLLEHCNLILGVSLRSAPVPTLAALGGGGGGGLEAGMERDGESSDGSSSLYLSESEDEAELEGEATEEAVPKAPLPWAAGACRDWGPGPPEDPGSAASALVAAPARGIQEEGKAALYAAAAAAAGSERHAQQSSDAGVSMAAPDTAATMLVQRRQHGGAETQPGGPRSGLGMDAAAWHETEEEAAQPESPSVIKARVRAATARQPASSSSTAEAGGSMIGSGFGGSLGGKPPSLQQKPSPTGSEITSSSSAGFEQAPEPAAYGATWRRLLCFSDPALERRFAQWHNSQQWQMDVLSGGLAAVLQLVLLSVHGAALPLGWLLLQLCSIVAPLAVMLAGSQAYITNRDAILALTYAPCQWLLCLTASNSRVHRGNGCSALLAAASCLCRLAVQLQARFWLQGPQQVLLFSLFAVARPAHCQRRFLGGAALACCPKTALQLFVIMVAGPLLMQYNLEHRARSAFLARLPLLA